MSSEGVKEQCDLIPLSSIVERCGVQVHKKSGYSVCRCPFHHDKNPSMMIKNDFFVCYGCGEKGDRYNFVMRYYDLDFKDALNRIAEDFGITEDSAPSVKRKKPVVKEIKEEKPKCARNDILHSAYMTMIVACGLTQEHLDHLRDVRKLTAEQIAGNYCSLPPKGEIPEYEEWMDKVIAKVFLKKTLEECDERRRKQIADYHQIIMESIKAASVPGLKMEKGTVKVTIPYKGYALACRDIKKHIVGMQVRKETGEGSGKYVWLSNSSIGGASSGTPGGIIYPIRKEGHSPVLCITEGRFKAEKIAEKGNVGIYVSGVSTWRSVIPYVNALCKMQTHIFMMFDADAMGNPAVYRNLKDMSEELSRLGFTPVLVLWRKEEGKGFDDLCINKKERYTESIKYIAYQRFNTMYERLIAELLAVYKVARYEDVNAESADEFKANLQRMIEKEIWH